MLARGGKKQYPEVRVNVVASQGGDAQASGNTWVGLTTRGGSFVTAGTATSSKQLVINFVFPGQDRRANSAHTGDRVLNPVIAEEA